MGEDGERRHAAPESTAPARPAENRASADTVSRRSAGKERVNARGDATRQLLLTTAEKLFAERGIAAVPLRDIGAAAGQKNHAVVQYHFGDKENLVGEIVAYRAAIGEERRVEMFTDLVVRGEPRVSDLVRVFVLPLAGHLEAGNHYLAFMSRYIIEHGGYTGLGLNTASAIPSTTVTTLRSLLGRLLSDLPDEVLDERWMLTLTSTVHTLARYQAVLASGRTLSLPMDALLEDLVRFLTAGIQAPIGHQDDSMDGLTSGTGRSRPAVTRGRNHAKSAPHSAGGES
ncbi:TetR/AcrR family transcriptional regulator [Rhodococcus opacus]|nr:TetR/AcrR family transcriptional regulator [Rhodococcus opacus]